MIKNKHTSKSGYTLVELIVAGTFVIILGAVISFLGFGGYVLFHFLSKVW